MKNKSHAHHIVVLTGAGISTTAGIPDFRGPDGVWTKHPEQMNVYDIDEFLGNTEARKYSWRWQKESPVWNARPGSAHKALVTLEHAGLLSLLATQNFDALHEKAGNSPDIIVNLHGTIATSHCMRCHAPYKTAEIMAHLDENSDPHCTKPRRATASHAGSTPYDISTPHDGSTSCDGLIKTDVTYFGEALPEGAIERCVQALLTADELWVIGSTLEVFPAASLVPLAARIGLPITIMNLGATQYDYLASRTIHEDIAVALPQLVDTTISRFASV